ncbi:MULTISPECIES: hypothetical protein [Streptomyces]|uniref:Tyr recombinase domain-containing protein n=1 Tax=Streptomyces venezuelae (strain ATCC 10712 / CBS 650.69 / DSM 40230 / JCM 4526 / NBRC 13096 / PD 04745) TaxID=953739 RepID=F2RKW5_STRVP|nr:hypothetical protein [Streptomyces venezuelae]APE21338.1 hypothetical protein vnz_10120 [Streptomyces venezuelae]CCA55354.1 hypothetical protein SVEN_2068 [Streptomyces venezuelae ATCC 10712]
MAYAEKVYKVRNGKQTKQFTWKAVYKKPDGTKGTASGFPTKKTAEDWGNAQEAAIRTGRWIDPSLMQRTFGSWAREWMKGQAPRGTTTARRWDRLEAVIFPRWGNVPMSQITWYEAESWANALAIDDVSVTHALSLMSTILNGAVDAKHLLVNPLAGRRRRRTAAAKEALQAKEEAKGNQYAPPEVVLQLARRAGPLDGMHILTVAFTGLRWGESIGLHRDNALLTRSEHYDGGLFECKVLRVVEEVAEYQERLPDGSKGPLVLALEPVKTRESNRRIDVPPFLEVLLHQHLENVKTPQLFMTRSGAFWRRGNFGRQVMKPVSGGRAAAPAVRGHAQREGWEPIMPGLTMRAMRHTHDTYQAQIGVKPILEFEQAGHKYPGIKGRYQHPTPEMRRERLEGLQEIYERAMRALGWTEIWPPAEPSPQDSPK